MNQRFSLSHLWAIFGLIFLSLPWSGCALQKVRSAADMYRINPLESVAVLTAGGAYGHRASTGTSEHVLALAESKAMVQHASDLAARYFEAKGYAVPYAEPVGIAYDHPWFHERLAVEQLPSPDARWTPFKLDGREPGFEYAVANPPLSPAFRQAVRRIFEGIEHAITDASISHNVVGWSPAMADLAEVRAVTGADAVCLQRVYGQLLLTGTEPSGQARPFLTLRHLIVNLHTGEVLYYFGSDTATPPKDLNPQHLERSLRYFPDRGKSIPSAVNPYQ